MCIRDRIGSKANRFLIIVYMNRAVAYRTIYILYWIWAATSVVLLLMPVSVSYTHLYPEANIEILKQDSEKITLIADAYVPVVKLEGDCIFEDNYFDLRKDVPKTIRLISAAEKITDNIEIKVLSEGRKNG